MSLPNGYKRLEYIQSTGTQYINTGFKPNNNTRVFLTANLTSTPTGNAALFGARTSANKKNYAMLFIPPYFRSDYNNTYTQTWKITATTKRPYDKNKETTTIDAISKSYTNALFQADYALYLFAINSAGVSQWYASMQMYACQIYDNGTLVRDFIPCQKSDGTVGLWDDVHSVFYGNAGTGTFTAGPVVVVDTPVNFRLSSSTDDSATLAWDAVDGATGYKLYRDGTLTATLADTSYTDTIQPFTSYIYALTAYNDSGESDPATISVQIIIPPEAPSNFRASSASMSAISLAWDAVNGVESYQLSRDGAVIYTGEYQSYTDRGLTAETAYTYTLSAVNSAGSSAETTLEAATTKFVLVTDRTAADVDAGNDKGTYKASDLNRVGAAMNYVADRLKAVGYDPHISPKTDWKDDDWADPYAQAAYLGELSELRKQFAMMESTPEVPPRILATGINTNDGLTHTLANDIEKILEDVDDLLTKSMQSRFFSGDLFSGEV